MKHPYSIPAFLLILFPVLCIVALSSCRPNPTSQDNRGSESLKIEYLAHASFLLTHGETTLLLDPFADSVWISYTFPKDIKADAIFSTHPHYDHDGGIFRNLNPYWQGAIPFYQDPGEYNMGSIKVTGLKGKHCDPYGKEFDQKNTIFIFEAAGMRIAHWGDNGPITDSLATGLTGIDILMIPIDDTYHILQANEIEEILAAVNPRIVIPMHYRIDELEPTPGKPKNLGPIDAYFENRSNFVRLDTHLFHLTSQMLPKDLTYHIFRHSPNIQ